MSDALKSLIGKAADGPLSRTEAEKKAYVFSCNFVRRNLAPAQKKSILRDSCQGTRTFTSLVNPNCYELSW